MQNMDDGLGIELTHPAFRDVHFILKKKYFIKPKNIWELKVIWMRRGHMLARETLRVTPEKLKEFKRL